VHYSILGGVAAVKLGLVKEGSFSFLATGEIAVIGMRGAVPLKTIVTRGLESISPECRSSIESFQQGHFVTNEFINVRTGEQLNILQHLQHHEDTVENANPFMLGVKKTPTSAYSLKQFRMYGVSFPPTQVMRALPLN
jgi:hypothetical protein